MSNALAIASVTSVLRNLLDNGVVDDKVISTVGAVNVTARAPDLIPLDQAAGSQLNLFLYRVTPNQGWRNVGQPTHAGNGERLRNAPLALDLHYFLTAYAARDLHAEILLGYGMQLLHGAPVLSRAAIRRALLVPVGDPGDSLPPHLEAIAASGLAEQIESIKIVLAPLSTEELSKLWSAFQSRYRPSAAYLVSVVLIEEQRSTRAPLPVRARTLHVVPFKEPVIERVLARTAPGADPTADVQILARHQLVLRGRRLRGERTTVRVGGATVVPAASEATDNEIAVPLPAGLEAGVQSALVLHEHVYGDPPAPHTSVTSNIAAFVLHPEVVAATWLPATSRVRVTLTPPVGSTQRVVLLLNELVANTSPPLSRPPRAYSFVAPERSPQSPPGPSATIDVPVRSVEPATYLLRVQVDGADSPLVVTGGRFAGPTVSIP